MITVMELIATGGGITVLARAFYVAMMFVVDMK